MAIEITINQNEDTTIEVANALAAADDKILLQIFYMQSNILNIATPNLAGKANDIIITPGVKYEFLISAVAALKLPTSDLTYKIYKILEDISKELLQDGDLTNTPLEGTEADPSNIIDFDTPIEIPAGKITTVVDLENFNNFYRDIDSDLETIYLTNFKDGKIKTLILTSDATGGEFVFSAAGLTIKWPGGAQPVHAESKTVIYSMQRIGDYIYVTVSSEYAV